MGKEHYNAVLADGSRAHCDMECESITYIAARMCERRFGAWPPKTGLCRESFSNPDGW